MTTPTYHLTVVKNRNWGTVTYPTEAMTEGTVAILTATPNEGYSFAYWSDGSSERENHRYTMPAKDVVVKAYFYKTDPSRCLIDLAALASFWTKVKTWFAEKSTALISGAKQIGFCKTNTSYISEDVQEALSEVKSQSDNSDLEIENVKRTYMPLPQYTYIVSSAGAMTFIQVTSNDVYNPYVSYYASRSTSNQVNFTSNKCTNRTYDASEYYWKITVDPITEDQIYTRWTGTQQQFDAEKDNLYHLDASGMNTWESYVTSDSLFTATPSGSTSMEWKTETQFPYSAQHPDWDGSMPHSGIMTVCGGDNNHITIRDNTANLTVWNAGRDKFGTGQEVVTFPVIKGHYYRVSAEPTRHGGGALGSIIIFLFGD